MIKRDKEKGAALVLPLFFRNVKISVLFSRNASSS